MTSSGHRERVRLAGGTKPLLEVRLGGVDALDQARMLRARRRLGLRRGGVRRDFLPRDIRAAARRD